MVVEGRRGPTVAASSEEIDQSIREALAAGAAVKTLSREIARRSRRPAREIYARALELAKS